MRDERFGRDSYGSFIAIGDAVAVPVDGIVRIGVVSRLSPRSQLMRVRIYGSSRLHSFGRTRHVLILDEGRNYEIISELEEQE